MRHHGRGAPASAAAPVRCVGLGRQSAPQVLPDGISQAEDHGGVGADMRTDGTDEPHPRHEQLQQHAVPDQAYDGGGGGGQWQENEDHVGMVRRVEGRRGDPEGGGAARAARPLLDGARRGVGGEEVGGGAVVEAVGEEDAPEQLLEQWVDRAEPRAEESDALLVAAREAVDERLAPHLASGVAPLGGEEVLEEEDCEGGADEGGAAERHRGEQLRSQAQLLPAAPAHRLPCRGGDTLPGLGPHGADDGRDEDEGGLERQRRAPRRLEPHEGDIDDRHRKEAAEHKRPERGARGAAGALEERLIVRVGGL
eukprot:CAMPEP_0185297890 /NCGR_PEP_ID=MMETSP1363-20130426/10178_1 /TAXON_ID=38817 /ORGANISM="Gephyrocapsa oceanica, Strain RCC1303" /LENGTH=309 /DNA_ID=CAMNT_0027894671 /DNA_START=117 /DNA_END=1042 /DNA_ORIENTATION=-